MVESYRAEPLKKKKRLDPQVIKAREERRKKKLEKQIRKLEKTAKQLKPLEELDVPVAIVDNYNERLRKEIKISPEEEESRWLLQKDWTRYMFKVNSAELRMIDRILASQHKALEELRNESEELYQAAIQLDFSYIPCQIKGPVETPPIKDFVAAEGDFHDISRKWE
ncbi:unnamed protein product [Orchesella dallaii]|uniref:Large ribosomal subunit protein mL40 n=1 Tax=Orchesella dallaii TaxID=48710 RepID=A0ABP1PYX4_9HEXA